MKIASFAVRRNPILKNPLKLREGMADIEGVVASGVEFDHDAVRKYIA